jgi:dimethylargininase
VSPRFAEALSANPQAIDLAREQHLAYCNALVACGLEVHELSGSDEHPDCCFVEDTVVIAEGRALIARMGAASRRGEVIAVGAAMQALGFYVDGMEEPATLDGGDCMRMGKTIYVGRSARTNNAGIAKLAAVFSDFEIQVIDLPVSVLHLKCVVSPLGDRVVLAEGKLDPARFPNPVLIPEAESYAANCVAVNGHAVVAAGFPRTLDAIAKAGFKVHPVATSEVRKADGSLTCQSILLDA